MAKIKKKVNTKLDSEEAINKKIAELTADYDKDINKKKTKTPKDSLKEKGVKSKTLEKNASDLTTEELVELLRKKQGNEDLSGESINVMIKKQEQEEHDKKIENLTTPELKEFFEFELDHKKKGLITTGLVLLFGLLIFAFLLYFVIRGDVETYDSLFYGLGMGFLLALVCAISLIIDLKEIKTLKKAVIDPEKYRYLTIPERPAYLDNEKEGYSTIKIHETRFQKFMENKAKKLK